MPDERDERDERPDRPARRSEIDMTTLIITAIASAAAAFITSRIWSAGTLASAAFTPVLVALVKEALHRPTEVVAGVEPKEGHHWKRAALTGLAGFAVFAAIITVSELLAGGSATSSKRSTTLFGGTRTVVLRERTVTVQTITNSVTTVTQAPPVTTVVTTPSKPITTTTTVTTQSQTVPTTPTETTPAP